MGIMLTHAALMAKAHQAGACFDDILTIGHLTRYISADQIRQLAIRFGRSINASTFGEKEYIDRFMIEFYGAKNVKSLDYSDYEKCDIVHDMNLPVETRFHQSFDVVIDGGSLEHIFNFPVAVANCMNMVKVGGSLFLFTNANNHMGHGFYQFSPELMFRIFQPENGFEIRHVILEQHSYPGGELSPKTVCYSVEDPAAVKERVGLVSNSPVMMMVHATRTASTPIFATPPIQSDYSSIYSGDAPAPPPKQSRLKGFIRSIIRRAYRSLPTSIQNRLNGQGQLWHYSFSNRRFYKRWEPLA